MEAGGPGEDDVEMGRMNGHNNKEKEKQRYDDDDYESDSESSSDNENSPSHDQQQQHSEDEGEYGDIDYSNYGGRKPGKGTMIAGEKGFGLSFWIKSYRVGNKEILNDVRGFVAPGEVLALMGPSGAGKTTLLDILAFRHTGAMHGTVLVNGQNLGANIKYACAFVPQNDQALLGILTVNQTMVFSSSFAVPSSYTLKEKSDRVDNMIKGLGLYRVRNSKVGTTLFRGISGGEKRRCSVGTQLLSDKPIVFLDEPTSGLDSYSAEKLIRDVKRLAVERSLSVICTVHQPNQKTLNHFDRMLFLSHGHAVFFGTAKQCIQHFQNLQILPSPFKGNLAEAVMDEVNIDFDLADGRSRKDELQALITNEERHRIPKKLESTLIENITHDGGCCRTCVGCMYCFVPSWCQSELATISGSTYRLGYVHSTWTNVFLLLRRFITLQVQDPFIFWVRALLIITMGFLVGFLFFQVDDAYEAIQDRISAYFFMILVTTFVSLTALPSAIEERVVVMHEFKTGTYRLIEYAIANILSRIPGVLLINSVFIILSFWLMDVGASARVFWTFYAIIILTNMVGESFMMAVGAFSPNAIIGVAVGITVYGLWMLTSGGIVPTSRMWIALRWLNYTSYYKYAIESMLLSSFPRLTFGCPTVIGSLPADCYVTGDNILDETYDRGGAYFLPNEWVGIACLVVWWFLFSLLYYGALLWQAWPSREKWVNRVLDTPSFLIKTLLCCCRRGNDDADD